MLLTPNLVAATIALAAIQSAGQSTGDLTAPPPVIGPTPKTCDCSDVDVQTYDVLRGLVIDAELTLGEDGFSFNERQATVFKIAKSKLPDGSTVEGRTRIWHITTEAKCGVTFDYGKRYSVAVKRNEDGQYETNACLLKHNQQSNAQTDSTNQ